VSIYAFEVCIMLPILFKCICKSYPVAFICILTSPKMGFSHIYYYYMQTSPLYTPPIYLCHVCIYLRVHTYSIFLHPFLTVLIVCRWIDSSTAYISEDIRRDFHQVVVNMINDRYDSIICRITIIVYIKVYLFHTLMITSHLYFCHCCCSYRTTLCLQHSPEHIGIGAIFLATLYMSLQPLNARSKDATWFEILDSDIEEEDLKSK